MANILKDYSIIDTIQTEVANDINNSSVLSGVYTAIPENAKDIEYQIKSSLQKQGLAIIILTPGFEYIGKTSDGNLAYQADELTIQITEYVQINRAKENYATALDIASYLQSYLGAKSNIFTFGTILPKSVEQGEDDGLIVANSKFEISFVQPTYIQAN